MTPFKTDRCSQACTTTHQPDDRLIERMPRRVAPGVTPKCGLLADKVSERHSDKVCMTITLHQEGAKRPKRRIERAYRPKF